MLHTFRTTAPALIVASAMLGCYGPVWPSRALTVRLETETTALNVLEIVDAYLISQGFRHDAKSGYDAITGRDTSHSYVREPVMVVISIDRAGEVPMRVNENAAEFGAEGMLIFDGLRRRLEQKWPGKVEVTS